MVVIKHVVFNSTFQFPQSPLQRICESLEIEGWELIKIVYHHEYESVAVFQRETVGEVLDCSQDCQKHITCKKGNFVIKDSDGVIREVEKNEVRNYFIENKDFIKIKPVYEW